MITKTIIITTSPFGNPVSDYYNCLAEEFIKHDYKVVFVFDGVKKINNKREVNKEIHFWPNNRPTKFADFYFFYKLIKKEKPVLCISNFGSTNVVSTVSYFLGIKNRINYIHTTSTQLLLDSTKSNFKLFFLKKRKKIIYNLNTLLLTNSEGTKKDSIKYYNISGEKIKVFPLLINKSNLKYKKREEREYSICIIGRLHPSKGHKELLYLFKKSLVDFPGLKLNIIGEGTLKEELIILAKELNIFENVFFLGNVSNKDIGNYFSKSLVNISSSIDEAYGLVNIEALREGTPLICTKTAGSLDILESKVNGEYFDHELENSLSNSLRIILNNWDHYSNNSIKTFINNYAKQNINKQFIEVINYISNQK